MNKRIGNELELEPISEEALEQERLQLLDRLKEIDGLLEKIRMVRKNPVRQNAEISELKGVNKYSPVEEKLKLFKNLFQGRQDVFARRFESAKTGKSGYQPVCENEWKAGICEKPMMKCAFCPHRKFVPYGDSVIEKHLRGVEQSGRFSRPFVAGIYPLLNDDCCYFLAVDFDEQTWLDDARAFIATCEKENIFAYLERSRSGDGGHVWIFFEDKIKAKVARDLGTLLLTKTLDTRPEIKLASFDRFFPNQDYMPKGGLGNLIALPLQKKAREKNHSVYIDPATSNAYEDQWAFLSAIKKNANVFVEQKVSSAQLHHEILPAYENETSDEDVPWLSRRADFPKIEATLPSKIDIVLSNQIFIDYTGLPAILRNRILRLASFQNPEFYQAQALRLPVWGKPRILYCYDIQAKYIGLPIGCLDKLAELLAHYKITPIIKDERNVGASIDAEFLGTLYPEQMLAAEALLKDDFGVLSATTVFGKTVVALWMIAQRKVNTLVLVHRAQLMEQWVERITEFLGIPKKEIGQISGTKKKRFGKIDVALITSVSRQGVVEEWVNDYGQIIVDECHHISAFSFEKAVRESRAKFKVGLSATLARKDGQHPIVLMNLGPVRYAVNAKKQAEERCIKHSVILRTTCFKPQSDDPKLPIQDVFRELWNNEARNAMVIDDVINTYRNGRQILLLTERTEHIQLFYEKMKDDIPALFVLKGGFGKKQLKQIFEDLNKAKENGNIVILATGRYIGEGFDLPELDTLFLPFPISWKGTLAQYVGRLHRMATGKTEVQVYDYVDVDVPVLMRMLAKRKKGYAALGYSIAESGMT